MIASASGMPPILIYRAASKTVDELVIKGMPLGAYLGFPYQQVKAEFSPGDTAIFMTDGFPELFNPRDEILDYPRAAQIFQAIAHSTPEKIIEHLVAEGEQWADGRQMDDDLTFVVLKFKEDLSKKA
jgi:sigma-B regulation protein RsbU (phosphoserine phosphatase)